MVKKEDFGRQIDFLVVSFFRLIHEEIQNIIMDIVCSIDNNYVLHCAVMLTSLFENNRSESHVIHLLTEGLTPDNRKLIEDLVHSYNGRFCYYLIDSDVLKSCPIKATDHLTIATYYRLLMADILPKSLERILYLDCDIVVNRSIKKLWEI
mgnify:CR=1 FL=1